MNAQKKPRRAPSLMMVMLIGPTGMDTTNPLMTPQIAAMTSP
jgi:hypothetical protein